MTCNPSPPSWWYDPDPDPEPYTGDIGPEDVEEPDDDEPEPWDGPEDYGIIDDSDFP